MPATASTSEVTQLSGLRVLHVVQKFSSGVGSAIAQYTRSLPSVEHHLISGTAVDAEGDLAEQARFTTTHRMTGSHLARTLQVRAVVQTLRPDVVHAHSSHGGAYARLAISRARHYVVYTPHCYAFERRDVPPAVRAVFWATEGLLAVNTSAFAACSAREWRLSKWPLRHAPCYLVPNIAPPARPRDPAAGSADPLVVGGGRLSPQKDPAFFLALVQRLRTQHPNLRAGWLGDGDPGYRATLEQGGVEVTGWLPRGAAMDLLSTAHLYLHSALWEGFPLMVAEAAALGVPVLVRRLPSFTEVPPELTLPGVDSLAAALACLEDPTAAAANTATWSSVLRHNTVSCQRAALAAAYTRGPAPGSSPQG